MNLFEAVKETIPTRVAAEHYGIEVKRNGMACCPFHNDKTPSMKVDTRFHCFGCQADGDVIDFVSRLFNLNPKEAAEKLADDFGINYDRTQRTRTQPRSSVLEKLAAAQRYRNDENRCFRVLCGYFHLLQDWKDAYSPKTPDEELNPLFCEALQETDYTEYLLDILISGTPEERAAVVKDQRPKLDALEKRVSEFAIGSTDGISVVRTRQELLGNRGGNTDRMAI